VVQCVGLQLFEQAAYIQHVCWVEGAQPLFSIASPSPLLNGAHYVCLNEQMTEVASAACTGL